MATLKWYGDKVVSDTINKARKANHRAGEALLTEANKTVPHDEGTLERSGFVDSNKNGEVLTVVAYDTPYAVTQHEDTTLSHSGKGRAKWLELTFKEWSNKLEKFVAKEIGDI